LTPHRSAHCDGSDLGFGPGARAVELPDDDRLQAYWRAYFSTIFNPARLKIDAMRSEMPKKYGRNMPETAALPGLIQDASGRSRKMLEEPVLSSERPRVHRPSAGGQAPEGDLAHLAREAAACRRCGSWQTAMQIVFGEGPADARVMLVGERPGDQEDLAGRPFVGPAGQVLNRALKEAGIDRAETYATNAVKHFKFEPRGKRRIHAKPDGGEIQACRFWLDREMALVRPAVTILLGASAARAVLGRTVTISRERGRALQTAHGVAMVTVHPSYLLRLPDAASKAAEDARFVEDLRAARRELGD
jgi:uracil-DNA glycosylase